MTKRTLPTFPAIIINALSDGDKLDSNDLHQHVRMHRGQRTPKNATDSELNRLCNEGRIMKSKNDMTDDNVSSIDSKYIYFLP